MKFVRQRITSDTTVILGGEIIDCRMFENAFVGDPFPMREVVIMWISITRIISVKHYNADKNNLPLVRAIRAFRSYQELEEHITKTYGQNNLAEFKDDLDTMMSKTTLEAI